MDRTALVVGVTGMAGYNASQALVGDGWHVIGLSRSQRYAVPGVEHLTADVLDEKAVTDVLRGRAVSHLVFATWSRQATEAENCTVNGAMLTSALGALTSSGSLSQVALITGLKHYLGPFEAYAASPAETPYRETQARLPYQNFYYDQEDILFANAHAHGFSWTVHRPHTLIGYAIGNVMNMGMTLAIYGSICRATGEPFVFPGSPEQLNGVTDITDARLLGRQVSWALSCPRAKNQALNTVNGDVFRWRQMWPRLAEALGVPAAPYPGSPTPLADRMGHADKVWARLVEENDLIPYRASELASWWHTDADLGRQVETFADMSKSRALGFVDYQDSTRSFTDLFELLRDERIIPRLS